MASFSVWLILPVWGLAFFAMSAFAAPVTINDQGGCASWTFAANTLTCVPGTGQPPPPPPPPPPVPPGSTNLCASAGFSKTIYYEWDWTAATFPHSLDTEYLNSMDGSPGIGTNGIIVVRFVPTLPANPGSGSFPYMANFTSTSFPGNSVAIGTLAISTKPCDFNVSDKTAFVTGTSSNVQYGIGPVRLNGFTGAASAVSLTPGTPYYINLANRYQVGIATPLGLASCFPDPFSVCDFRLTLFKPSGH